MYANNFCDEGQVPIFRYFEAWAQLKVSLNRLQKPGSNLGVNGLSTTQGSHRLEKYLNLEGFLEKSLKNKPALKNTGKSLKSLEKSLNSTILCRT